MKDEGSMCYKWKTCNLLVCVNESMCPSGHQVGEGPPVTVYILARGRKDVTQKAVKDSRGVGLGMQVQLPRRVCPAQQSHSLIKERGCCSWRLGDLCVLQTVPQIHMHILFLVMSWRNQRPPISHKITTLQTVENHRIANPFLLNVLF